MPLKKQFSYNIGDRVAERPKTHGLIAIREEVKERIAQYRSQRYGTIIDIFVKDKAKGKQTMLVIQWDHLKSPTVHAQMRICPIDELANICKNTMVPGEF